MCEHKHSNCSCQTTDICRRLWMDCVCSVYTHTPRLSRRLHLTDTFLQAADYSCCLLLTSQLQRLRRLAVDQSVSAERPSNTHTFRCDSDQATVLLRSSSHLSASSWLCIVVTISLLHYLSYLLECDYCSLDSSQSIAIMAGSGCHTHYRT